MPRKKKTWLERLDEVNKILKCNSPKTGAIGVHGEKYRKAIKEFKELMFGK